MRMIPLVGPTHLSMTSSATLLSFAVPQVDYKIAYIYLEFSFTAKHVEEHGRSDAYDPWSIRQIGVHHKFLAARNQNTFVLLNPSLGLIKRMDSLGYNTEALKLHRLILCTVTERWIQYLAYLELVCKDIVSRPTHLCS